MAFVLELGRFSGPVIRAQGAAVQSNMKEKRKSSKARGRRGRCTPREFPRYGRRYKRRERVKGLEREYEIFLLRDVCTLTWRSAAKRGCRSSRCWMKHYCIILSDWSVTWRILKSLVLLLARFLNHEDFNLGETGLQELNLSLD